MRLVYYGTSRLSENFKLDKKKINSPLVKALEPDRRPMETVGSAHYIIIHFNDVRSFAGSDPFVSYRFNVNFFRC